MTYKWEAIAQDLTEERDRLLKENERLRKTLETFADEVSMVAGAYGLEHVVDAARAALKSEKQ